MVGAVRLPKIVVITIDDFVSAQKRFTSKDEDETAELRIFDGKLDKKERAKMGIELDGGAIKRGELSKLGGAGKDKWQKITFALRDDGLHWTSKGTKKSILKDEIGRVATWSGISHGFEVGSSKKAGKVYRFSATDDADRDSWMRAIEQLTGEHEEHSRLDQSGEATSLKRRHRGSLVGDTRVRLIKTSRVYSKMFYGTTS